MVNVVFFSMYVFVFCIMYYMGFVSWIIVFKLVIECLFFFDVCVL